MRFAITADHLNFFSKNHYISFEGLLPVDQVDTLRAEAENALANRLQTDPSKLPLKPSAEIYRAGYDLSRESEAIQKITRKHALATLASELFQTVPLRYGFDLYIISSTPPTSPIAPSTLQESTSLRPILGALILPLKDLTAPLPFFPLPQKKGDGLFISPSLPIPWPELFALPEIPLLLIAYAAEKTFFRAETTDIHASDLKKLGYAYNDLLKNSLHPLLVHKHV